MKPAASERLPDGLAGRLAAWLLLALILWLGLAFSRTTHDPILPKTGGAWLAISVALVLLALDRTSAPRRPTPDRPQNPPLAPPPALSLNPQPSTLDRWAVAAFALYAALALLSPWPWRARSAVFDVALALAAYAAGRLAWRRCDAPRVAWALALAASLAGGVGLVELAFPGWLGFTVQTHKGDTTRALVATMGNPDYFAGWLLLSLPPTAALARAGGLGGRVAAASVAFQLFLLALTFSRSAWLAAAVELLLLGVADRRRTLARRPNREGAPPIEAPGLLAAGKRSQALKSLGHDPTISKAQKAISEPGTGFLPPQPAGLGASSLSPFARRLAVAAFAVLAIGATTGIAAKLLSTATLTQRFLIWRGALSMTAERPWTGQGPGAFGAAFPDHRPPEFREARLNYVNDFAHNWLLHALATCGLAGGLLAIAGVWALARDSRGSLDAATIAVAGALVHDTLSVTLCLPSLAVANALVLATPRTLPPEADRQSRAPRHPSLAPPHRPTPSTHDPHPTSRAPQPPTLARPPTLDREPEIRLPSGRSTPTAARVALALAAVAGLAGLQDHRAREESDRLLRQAREAMSRHSMEGAPSWPARAIPLLEGALARTPFDAPARYRLAAAHAYSGDLVRAQAAYLLLEATAGSFAELPYDRGEVYRAMGRLDAARPQAAHWIDMNGRDARSHVLAARIEQTAGNLSLAREKALQAKILEPSHPEVRRLLRELAMW